MNSIFSSATGDTTKISGQQTPRRSIERKRNAGEDGNTVIIEPSQYVVLLEKVIFFLSFFLSSIFFFTLNADL